MLPDAVANAVTQAAQASSENLAPVGGRVLHVDGDYLAYYAAGGDDMPAGTARMVAKDRILSMMRLSRSSSAVLQLTDEASDKGLRYKIATVKPYQGNRKGASHPKNWSYVRDYLRSATEFNPLVWKDREADDGIALAAYSDDIVIASTDKDMRMLPGLHLDWKAGTMTEVPRDAYSVVGENGLQYGLKWFCLQMLQGDAADNCPGLEFVVRGTKRVRCGEKTAEALLDGIETFEHAIAEVAAWYERCYADEWADRFVEQAGLMWLRQTALPSPTAFMLVLSEHHYAALRGAAEAMMNRIGYEQL